MIVNKDGSPALNLLSGYPLPNEGTALVLPVTAQRMYGCSNCEWKIVGLCPHDFQKGKGFKEKNNCHPKGICMERINYLLSFTHGEEKRPSFYKWQLDFNKGLAQIQMNEEFAKLKLIESKLQEALSSYDKAVEAGDVDAIKDARRYLNHVSGMKCQLRNDWFNLWDKLTKLDDAQVDRETPKKVDITTRDSIPLSRIHEIMRGETIEAQFKIEKEEEIKEEKKEDASIN